MKKFGLLISILIYFVFNITPAQNVFNPGFDNWTASVPDGWTLDIQGGDCTFSETTGETNSALRCTVTINGTGNDGEFNQVVTNIVAGQNYDFQIRVKSTSAVTNALRFWGSWQCKLDFY